ncbi:hypothetical protein [Micromonospora sp. NPDC047074]|uniref:hypothetical protein n=1 Tax=Micromonospora sp. NPDC047074 TaxID=3154339 RepID=UPI0033E8B439
MSVEVTAWTSVHHAMNAQDERPLSRATLRRVAGFARPHRTLIVTFLLLSVVTAVLTVAANRRTSPAGSVATGRSNMVHWVRDVTCDEDRSQVRIGTEPRSWSPCATLPSAPCAPPASPTSPPPTATTPATAPAPWRLLGIA